VIAAFPRQLATTFNRPVTVNWPVSVRGEPRWLEKMMQRPLAELAATARSTHETIRRKPKVLIARSESLARNIRSQPGETPAGVACHAGVPVGPRLPLAEPYAAVDRIDLDQCVMCVAMGVTCSLQLRRNDVRG